MIRVICVDISSAEDELYRRLYENASVPRKCRADRYMRQKDKLRCVTAEALLRSILGVTEDQIEKNCFGKPYIKARKDVFYNLSHSGRYVVLAWGDTEVGVDVQQHDPATDRNAIEMRFFAPDEQRYVCGDIGRFYEIWTKKESYLKYTGRGLRRDLRSFSVLSMEQSLRFFYGTLDDDHSLSLCTVEDEYVFERLDIQQLR